MIDIEFIRRKIYKPDESDHKIAPGDEIPIEVIDILKDGKTVDRVECFSSGNRKRRSTMAWSKNINPKSSGWYLCTVEVSGGRFVMPVHRVEYPKGNFAWNRTGYGKVVACVKFPKPYDGAIADDKHEQMTIFEKEK